jgi:hypothetical protein
LLLVFKTTLSLPPTVRMQRKEIYGALEAEVDDTNLYVFQYVLYVPGATEEMLFSNTRKNIKREKLLNMVCFSSQVLHIFAWDELLRRYTVYIISSKKLTAVFSG